MAFSMRFTQKQSLGAAVREVTQGATAKIPKLLDDAGRYMVRTHIPEVFQTGGIAAGQVWRASNRGGKPMLDTGTLRRSFQYRVESGRRLIIATTLPYAGIHNEGGVIVPKKAKYLAVPMPALKVSERRAGSWLQKDKLARRILKTFVARSRAEGNSGKLFIFRKLDSGKIEPIYILMDQVVIPRRTFLTWSDLAQDEIMERWGRIITAPSKTQLSDALEGVPPPDSGPVPVGRV